MLLSPARLCLSQEIVSALPLDMFVYLLGGSLTTQMSLGMLRLLRIRHVARFLLCAHYQSMRTAYIPAAACLHIGDSFPSRPDDTALFRLHRLVEQGTSFNYNVLILVKAALVILYLCHLCAPFETSRGVAPRACCRSDNPSRQPHGLSSHESDRSTQPLPRCLRSFSASAPFPPRFACWFWYIGERTNQPPDSTWSGIGTMDKFGVYELESFGSQYLTVSRPVVCGKLSARWALRRDSECFCERTTSFILDL